MITAQLIHPGVVQVRILTRVYGQAGSIGGACWVVQTTGAMAEFSSSVLALINGATRIVTIRGVTIGETPRLTLMNAPARCLSGLVPRKRMSSQYAQLTTKSWVGNWATP